MAKGRVQLKLPEKALREILRLYGDDALVEIRDAFKDAASEAMSRMIEIAPYDTGALEASASLVQNVTPRGRRAKATFEFTAEYAGIVHELPEHARGPGTRTKPGNEYGPAGPKYIERVLRGFKLGPLLAIRLRDFWRAQRKVKG